MTGLILSSTNSVIFYTNGIIVLTKGIYSVPHWTIVQNEMSRIVHEKILVYTHDTCSLVQKLDHLRCRLKTLVDYIINI